MPKPAMKNARDGNLQQGKKISQQSFMYILWNGGVFNERLLYYLSPAISQNIYHAITPLRKYENC